MKFTNGYWLIRPEFEMNYAVELVDNEKSTHSLTLLAATKHIEGRGDSLNKATLSVTITAPARDVLRVKLVHHKGVKARGPYFETNAEEMAPCVTENEQNLCFCNGRLCARISKRENGWGIAFEKDGALLTSSGFHGMAHAYNRLTQKTYVMDSLSLDAGERVYGLGERFTDYVKNGQAVDMWNADGGTASELAYKNVPFYMTNRGYGVFVEDCSDVSFEVASEKVERVQFSLEGESLVYDLICGDSPKAILERYTFLTGRPALPPAWSFGLWLTTSFTTDYDEKTVRSLLLDGMLKRKIPLHVFHFDCFWMKGFHWCDFIWNRDVFPDPQGMLGRLHEDGLRICVWINPYIAQESSLFDEAMEKGYLLTRENGDVWQTDLWQAGMGIVDFTNPMAASWYAKLLENILDMGVDCFKTDFGERIPVRDIRYHDGSDPLKMHNYYAQLYNKVVFELLEKKRGAGEAVLFARSATAGGQQFPCHWGGDNSATYISMAETLRAGLSLAHSGFAFWSHDISGFEQTAPADVYKRWTAFGLLSSHSRLHGSTSYRVPWLFGEEACEVMRRFVCLKCKLMPYLYAAAAEAHEAGTPVLRPMMFEFPQDIACETTDLQYMLGERLLIAPIFHESGEVNYYLPKGRWTNLFTGKVAEGCGYRKEKHDFMSLPLMVRENTILPIGANAEHPDYDYADGITLHVYEPGQGQALQVSIPNLAGQIAATFTLTVTAEQVEVQTNSQKPYSVILHRDGVEKRLI
ncbi:MAG: alpha-xylosidase [Clostridia bacterium]